MVSNRRQSYALGKQGATRKKLEAAAHCILQYVGNTIVYAGQKIERQHGKESAEHRACRRARGGKNGICSGCSAFRQWTSTVSALTAGTGVHLPAAYHYAQKTVWCKIS